MHYNMGLLLSSCNITDLVPLYRASEKGIGYIVPVPWLGGAAETNYAFNV